MADRLYNGIQLPDTWPPKNIQRLSKDPLPVPYLQHPPRVLPVLVGRQLFVDDFLIEATSLQRVFHHPVKYAGNPIFTPQTAAETETLPCACPKSGGIWYDEGKFKMWYEAGWLNKLAYAESTDGLTWERPQLGVVPGTNLLLPGMEMDSTAVFIDPDTADPVQRYKLFVRGPGGLMPGTAHVSADGIHWSPPVDTAPLEDRSTMFYNPFRKKWVYSIRRVLDKERVRLYRECDDYIAGAQWTDDESVFWQRVDNLDQPDPAIGMPPQLYNFDVTAYESIMLGMFQIHLGPENSICRDSGIPKITELQAAYSRDGFHFSRPDRTAFIPASRQRESWDRGYVQSVGGVCLIRDDEIWFYYIGFRGDEGRTHPYGRLGGMHDNSATGLATLRRDGFASMDGTGQLVTRPLTALGRDRLFVNAKVSGTLRAELRLPDGSAVPGYTFADSITLCADSTKASLSWRGGSSLPVADGKPFRLAFDLQDGALYSFWLSDCAAGESYGMTAAGLVKE